MAVAAPPKVIHFHSDALAEDDLVVLAYTGEERMSALYRFDLELVSKKPDIDFAAVLSKAAWLGLKAPVKLRDGGFGSHLIKVGGMIRHFQQEDQRQEWYRYRAVLAPQMWKLTITHQSRIFMKKPLQEIVRSVLGEHGISGDALRLEFDRPARDYVVQWQESDFAFLSRWLEHEGIYYYFEHSDDSDTETVVFADATSAYGSIPGDLKVPYHARAGSNGSVVSEEGSADWFGEEAVLEATIQQHVIPAKMVLKDYNYRTPTADLNVKETIHDEGVGTVYQYGAHYKDAGEGAKLAKVRAEEIKCRRRILRGASDDKAFHAGHKFELTEHYRGDLNEKYLLTSVRHRASQSLGNPFSALDVKGTRYGNQFEAIPASETFRPERTTPWPKIEGVMHAKVDAAGDGKYAEVNDEGDYKVKVPFDLSDLKDGGASRYVRMAQPYGGAEFGFHAPLHKDSEVILTHLDGNPDRPILSGFVPDPLNPSVIKASNQTQCDWKSCGNNEIRFEDQEGSEQIYVHGQKDWEILIENDKNQTIGHDETLHVKNNRTKNVDVDQSETIGNNKTIDVGNDHGETIGNNMTLNVGTNRTSTIGVDDQESVGSNQTITVGLNQTETIAVNCAQTIGAAKELTIGAVYQVTVGAAMNETVGAVKAMEIGADHIVKVGGSADESVKDNKQLAVGKDFTEGITGNHTETTSKDFSLVVKQNIGIEGKEEIVLRSGKSSITLKKDGSIILEGKDITIKGSGEVNVKSDKDVVIKGQNVLEN